MKTNERRFQVTVHYKANDNGIIADGMNETKTATAEQAANWIIAFAEENSNYTVTEFSIRDCETFKKYRSNDADLQALVRENVETKAEVKTIETKIAKNGVKLYYVNGKRTSKAVAMEIAANNERQIMSSLFEQADTDNVKARVTVNFNTTLGEALIDNFYFDAIDAAIDAASKIIATFADRIISIRVSDNGDWNNCKIFAASDNGNPLTVYNITEPNPDDYAVNPDAFDIAVNAEIQNANNVKINDLKWEIRYVEGSINDLDKNHIAHAPNDQSLKERRTELVNELDNLNAQLAELLPTEPNTNSEYKYYIQSRRPIAGAVPNGYISATQGDMKVHSLRSDGSISIVPRKVVFGLVVYDHPLSDQQIINYDLHVDPLNPKVEPDTTELSDQEVAEIKRRSQINAIKSRIATYERAIERQYDAELENSLIAAKAQLAEIEPANTPEVDPITQERETARNEYDQLNQVRKVIENDVERFERLRDRCKPSSPKHKEYNQLLESFDPIIRAFGDKFIAAQDRYNQSLTLRTDEEKAATQKAIDEHNADLDARGIKYFATVYYYPNGVEGEDMETFHKDCTSLDEAKAFVSQEDIDGVYVGGIYDAGWEITDRNHNLIADHITGIKEENVMTIKDQADFYADKIKRECAPIDDSTTDRDEVFNLLPDLDNDVEKVWLTKGELDDLTAKFRDAVSIIPVTTRIEKGLPATITITKQNRTKPFDMGFGAFAKYSIVQWITGLRIMRNFSTLGIYDTPAQVEKVIDLLKAAITRGDKAFTFPTVEELDPNPDDELIDPPAETLNHKQKKNLRDSLERAKQIACKNIRVARRNHNKDAEDYERELYDICNQALKEVA